MNRAQAIFGAAFSALIFLIVWVFLASHLPGWSDETGHMHLGKSMVLTGQPIAWRLDESQLSHLIHARAFLISYMVGFVNHFDQSLLGYRLVPLVFTLLTYFLFVFFLFKVKKIDFVGICILSVFFFGQSVILEKALYVRYYAPLAFFLLAGLICLWEGQTHLKTKKYVQSLLWNISSILILLPPTLDDWQTHIPIFILAIFLIYTPLLTKIFGFLSSPPFPRKIVFLAFLLVFILPFTVPITNILITWVPMGTRTLGRTFLTYWDNIMGLLRFFWVTNVCLIGFPWLLKKTKKNEKLALDFVSWIYCTGVISGLLIGLLNPAHFIFESRYFYLPVVLVVLGFSGMFMKVFGTWRSRNLALATYLCLNVLFSFVNFYFDRSNIFKAIGWLNNNVRANDVVLNFYAELDLYGGGNLEKQSYPINLATRDSDKIQAFIDVIDRDNVHDVYFLYDDHYQFKHWLYEKMMHVSRDPSDLFRYLKNNFVGEEVISGLRGCGLHRYKKEDLVAELQKLKRTGFANRDMADLSFHKYILKKIIGALGMQKYKNWEPSIN